MSEKTCKVFTPLEVVKYMLDKIGYTEELYGKKILENSCGTGHFLCEIAARYIRDARKNQMKDDEIIKGLEADICGIEKEKEVYGKCLENLDHVAAEQGINNVSWNVRMDDALSLNLENMYQFVVGNPPYITYYNMTVEDRELVRSQYEVCKSGKPDYYYAFTEAALKALLPGGKMIYLIPNNFMKNRDSERLRNYILPYLTELEDFKFERIFEGRLTSSAIILCSKEEHNQTSFLYRDKETGDEKWIMKESLRGKWALDAIKEDRAGLKKFGDCFKVSAPVATLLNEAFVIKGFTENADWIEKDGYRLEKVGLRPAASPKSMQYGGRQYAIFPYYYKDGKCYRYDEEEFVRRFPGIAGYLSQFGEKLSKRKTDKNSRWFEYGRSQALAHIDQEKLMLSTLITGNVKYYHLDRETVPYSGMYIVPRGGYTLKQAEQLLDSREFFEYIQSIGIHANGKTYRVSPKDVENFVFREKW